MDLLVFMKQAAEIGISPPVIIAAGILYQQLKTNACFDKRLAILEAKAAN